MKIEQAWIVCCIALLSFITAGCSATSQSTNANLTRLPVLNWQEHSDWINVKTDVTPKAIGNGKADDTKAIQAAIDKVASSNERGGTVYLPPGTYRITQSLKFIGRKVGANMIGNGRDTRIVWDGASDGKMLFTNGLPYFRFRGIVLDGRDKASVGIWSYNTKAFITDVVFEDSAFIHLRGAGIYYVPQDARHLDPTRDVYANAETVYKNCLFADVGTGVHSQSFNDYDHTFSGCEFVNCNVGIHFGHGNFYIRDTHFQGGGVNIWSEQAEHSCSIRRVTSVGAERFLNFHSSVTPLTIQDCHVADWKNPKGAMRLHVNVALLFDNTFSNSKVAGPVIEEWDGNARRIVSNNSYSGLTTALFGRKTAPRLYHIPGTNKYPTNLTASQSFLTNTVEIPGKIFDAKNFGAVGDGKTDDTQAIQKTIDAARSYGNNAIAYLPRGQYVISDTLRISGTNYFVGGNSAFGTSLIWKGKKGGTMVHVTAPHNITIQNLSVGQTDSDPQSLAAIDILQSGSLSESSICYKNVYVYGRYKDDSQKGLYFRNLGANEKVLIEKVQGNLHFENSARATILVNVSYSGVISISGKSKARDGFLGFMTRFSGDGPYLVIIKNNNNLVASDFYFESAKGGFLLSGEEDDPPGRFTIQSPKINFYGNPKAKLLVLDNYAGNIYLGPSQFSDSNSMKFDLDSKHHANIFLLGNVFYSTAPEILHQSPSVTFNALSNIAKGIDPDDEVTPIDIANLKDSLPKGDYKKLKPALDDLRQLGQVDLLLNFPWIKK